MNEPLPIEIPRNVSISAIEQELQKIREETDLSGDQPLTRMCTNNLIVVIDAPGKTDAIQLVSELAAWHPGRTILIAIDPDESDHLTAEVSSLCNLSLGGRKQVCSEFIIITAGPHTLMHLHSIVSPILVHDLPVFLNWRIQRPIGDLLFQKMTSLCEHIIIDSAQFKEAETQFPELMEFLNRTSVTRKDNWSLSDINWTRFEAIRAALSGLFDAPDRRHFLEVIKSVEIIFEKDSPGKIQALLLTGWLACALGWTQRSSSLGGTLQFEYEGNAIDLDLRALDTDAQSQFGGMHIKSVHLDCSRDLHAMFSIIRSGQCLRADAEIADGNAGRVIRCEERGESALLATMMNSLSRHTLYECALEKAARMSRVST